MEDGLVLFADQSPRIFERWVLILVVMEDGLVRDGDIRHTAMSAVLILVVMEDGLVLKTTIISAQVRGFNPCCNGRWSRTTIISANIRINRS